MEKQRRQRCTPLLGCDGGCSTSNNWHDLTIDIKSIISGYSRAGLDFKLAPGTLPIFYKSPDVSVVASEDGMLDRIEEKHNAGVCRAHSNKVQREF